MALSRPLKEDRLDALDNGNWYSEISWPNHIIQFSLAGKAVQALTRMLVRVCFDSPFSFSVVVLWTLSCDFASLSVTIKETVKQLTPLPIILL